MPINDAYFKKKYGQRNEDQVFVGAICRHLLRSCKIRSNKNNKRNLYITYISNINITKLHRWGADTLSAEQLCAFLDPISFSCVNFDKVSFS